MRIGQLEQHCGICGIIDFCGEPYSEICLCANEILSDMTVEEYKEKAEKLRDKPNKEIERMICKERSGSNGG